MDKQLCMMILLLFEVFWTKSGNISQLHSVLLVPEGETAVLSCFITTKQISVALWYKQVIGEEPHLIISSLLHSSNVQFHNEFDNSHFHVSRSTDSFNLMIVNTTQSDSATYYCATSFSNIITFGDGTRLVIKGAEINKGSNLQLVESEVNAPLQCSVQNQLVRGGGEHRFYWFKHGSEESPPGSVYVRGNTSDPCVRSSESDCLSPTCVYNLPKKSFSPSGAGLYHCALATCREALFGHFSKLNPDSSRNQNLFFLQICLAALLAISLTINILLYYFRKNGRNSQQIQTADEDGNYDVSTNQNMEMTYATVKTFSKHWKVKRERSHEETLYSGLACQQQS